jgi:hypothetical protein
MSGKLLFTGAICTLLAATLPVQAAEPMDLKLGLWETSVTTKMSGSLMPESALKQMSPEQRARMEAAMKKREADGPKTHTTRTCLTKEKLNRPFEKQGEAGNGNCKNTIVTATRTVQDYKIQCTGPEARSGVMHMEATSRESFKSTVKMTSSRNTVNVELNGRWVASDCGKEKG